MKPHRFDPVSFAAGMLFLVTGALLLSGEVDLADLSGRGILVLPVLFVGVLLVAVGIRRVLEDRRSERASDEDGDTEDLDPATDTEPIGR
jgi:hypothetical protein